eukprot:3001727-Prymnesium_polylepis.1
MLDAVLDAMDGPDAARARPTHPLEVHLVEPQQAHPQHVVDRALHHYPILHVHVHLEVRQGPVAHEVVGRCDGHALRAPCVVQEPRETRLRVRPP